MKLPLWYSIPARQARKLIRNGQKATAQLRTENDFTGVITLLDFDTHNHKISFCIDQEYEFRRFAFDLNYIIFKTDDRRLEIILPGEVVVTIDLV